MFSLFFFLAFGVAHQAVEEVDPTGDTILVQGEDFVFHSEHRLIGQGWGGVD